MSTNYTLRWFLTIFIGLVFAGSGAAKLAGDPVFTSYFRDFGIPMGYMHALGFLELMGAFALCVPVLARYANVGFLIVAAGAAVMHVMFGRPVAALLPMALASAAAIAIWGTPGHPAAPPEPKVLSDEPQPSGGGWDPSLAAGGGVA